MNKVLNIFEGLVDQLTRRERIFVLLGILSVLYMIWDTLLISPIQTAHKSLNQERLTIQKQLAELQVRNILATGLLKNKNKEKFVSEIAQYKNKITSFEQTIKERLKDRVPPESMVTMLSDMLQKNNNLQLVLIHNLPAEPLTKKHSEENNKDNNSDNNVNTLGIFMHPLEMELEGSYLDILDYLKALETLKWKIFWDHVQLNVVEYPKVKVHIKVHTFSLKDGWLSV